MIERLYLTRTVVGVKYSLTFSEGSYARIHEPRSTNQGLYFSKAQSIPTYHHEVVKIRIYAAGNKRHVSVFYDRRAEHPSFFSPDTLSSQHSRAMSPGICVCNRPYARVNCFMDVTACTSSSSASTRFHCNEAKGATRSSPLESAANNSSPTCSKRSTM